MTRLIRSAFAATLALSGGAAAAEVRVRADPSCTVIRIQPNGKRIVTPPTRAHRPHGPSFATAVSAGEGSSSSSVSMSSSGGRGHATASSTTGGRGHAVTTTHDDNGCTVVIDRRRGARR